MEQDEKLTGDKTQYQEMIDHAADALPEETEEIVEIAEENYDDASSVEQSEETEQSEAAQAIEELLSPAMSGMAGDTEEATNEEENISFADAELSKIPKQENAGKRANVGIGAFVAIWIVGSLIMMVSTYIIFDVLELVEGEDIGSLSFSGVVGGLTGLLAGLILFGIPFFLYLFMKDSKTKKDGKNDAKEIAEKEVKEETKKETNKEEVEPEIFLRQENFLKLFNLGYSTPQINAMGELTQYVPEMDANEMAQLFPKSMSPEAIREQIELYFG